ncbi:Rv1679 family acyl-CoA dehydrogenase [Agromyces mangrovi Wang et al. 2018]|uniref:Rv1679 family acyl-CoA dehydrogenase n=1 Tax=Agromyces mangrovi TaxID=1858653 RepID=UPI002573955B|nr:acyl-CoA dehydrogenase family protein [Agromyces mangrovi]BDZ65324.1 acyl-CoA dehydrogenase [Agromyces mangrovi]
MDLHDRLDPMLAIAREHATDVDQRGRFPDEAVQALRDSGLMGLTLPPEVGGLGGGPQELVDVLGEIAGACGSTAMITLMHFAAVAPLSQAVPSAMPDLLADMASGRTLGTLAFSEKGSRSHFWSPVSQPKEVDGRLHVVAQKSWVTSAGYADVYVSSAKTPDGTGVDLYALASDTPGVTIDQPWSGMGFRGNASSPMTYDVDLDDSIRLGEVGAGTDLMLGVVLPWFNLGNAAVSLGLSRASVDAAIRHTTGARLQHLDQTLSALPTIRAQLARMSIELAAASAYLDRAAGKVASPEEDTPLFVLGSKAASNDAALRITDAAMRVCGGAAFSQHLSIDRYFRDARAGHVMAPTADALYEFYGRAITGRPLFDPPADAEPAKAGGEAAA